MKYVSEIIDDTSALTPMVQTHEGGLATHYIYKEPKFHLLSRISMVYMQMKEEYHSEYQTCKSVINWPKL